MQRTTLEYELGPFESPHRNRYAFPTARKQKKKKPKDELLLLLLLLAQRWGSTRTFNEQNTLETHYMAVLLYFWSHETQSPHAWATPSPHVPYIENRHANDPHAHDHSAPNAERVKPLLQAQARAQPPNPRRQQLSAHPVAPFNALPGFRSQPNHFRMHRFGYCTAIPPGGAGFSV